MIIKCTCKFCGGNVEFDAASIGEKIACPHCNKNLKLYVPRPADKSIEVLKAIYQKHRSRIPWVIAGVFMISTVWLLTIVVSKPVEKPRTVFSQLGLEPAPKAKKSIQFPPAIAGKMEFTTKLIENFPERVNQKAGWMDGQYLGIESEYIKSKMGEMSTQGNDSFVGFYMFDKNTDVFSYCVAHKNKWGNFLLELKRWELIRVIGTARSYATDKMWIDVESIQVIR